jgi:hypothetical protein
VGILLSIIPYFVLAFTPVWNQLRHSKKTVFVWASLCTLLNITSVIVIMRLFPNWSDLRIFHSIFFLLLYVVIYVLMVRGTAAKLVFVAFLVKSYADFIVSMAKFLEVNFLLVIEHRVYVASSYSFYFNLFQLLILLATYPLIWFFFRRKITKVIKTHNRAWSFLWIIPLVYYIINLAFAALNASLIAQWQFLVFNLTSFFGFLLIYYVVIEMLEQSEKNILLSENNKIISQQLTLQAAYYQKFGLCIEETRKGQHDLRHHLTTLQSLLQHNRQQTAQNYIAELLGDHLSLSEILYCDNDAVNALLGYYANRCQQHNIDLQVATELPDDLQIEETDLCVLFGNLLENATEACLKITDGTRRIQVASRFVNQKLFITVDNSFCGELGQRDGVYLSQKRNNAVGIGLSSIQSIADKYAGTVRFEPVAQLFQVSVVLENKSAGAATVAFFVPA